MKLLKIFQLEFTYQLRQVPVWIYFAVLFSLSYFTITLNNADDAREGYFLLNAPINVTLIASIGTLFWLLIGASVAGDAATRDVQTRMFSFTYLADASKAEYLGGRFFAALVLNLLVLLAIPVGYVLAIYFTGIEQELLGQFRPAAYVTTFFFIVLPNITFATAIQFSLCVIKRNAMFSYVVGTILFFASYPLWAIVDGGQRGLGALLDPLYFTPISHFQNSWSPIERNTRLISLEGMLLANRLVWLAITFSILAFAYFRFRFTSYSTKSIRKKQSSVPAGTADVGPLKWSATVSLPRYSRAFGLATHLRQLRLTTIASFWALARKPAGLLLLGAIAAVVGLAMSGNLAERGTHLLPRTDQILNILAAPITAPGKFWIIIFTLAIFYAGELIWRERESGLSELANVAPVPEWVLFLSKFFSLSMLLVFMLVFMLVAGVLAQLLLGGADVEMVPYVKVLFGFQLVECLLFVALALFVHTLINHKYLGHLVMLSVLGCIMFTPLLGFKHKLIIFGASPPWSYTSMDGFGVSVEPWLWFKAYWAAWALLLAVLGTLLWVRSRDESLKGRLLLARRRFTRTPALMVFAAVGLMLVTGSFIFYNTNMLNAYESTSTTTAGRAMYEHLYGKYSGVPQPVMTRVELQVEIYPDQHILEIKGAYRLVNKQSVAINSIYLGTPAGAETTGLIFNKPVTLVHANRELGVIIYTLKQPLRPGDSLQLGFKVRHEPKGFTNYGADSLVTPNFTQIKNYDWLPVIGYQQYREVDEPGLRKKYGLSARPVNASLYDVKARNYAPFAEPVSVNMIAGTKADQTVVAPGSLRKTWKQGNRRYFQYATDAPIRNDYSFLSAKYALYEDKWTPPQEPGKPVAIQIYYDPGNTTNLPRIMKSLKSSLAYYTEQFGPYPHHQLRLVARAGYGGSNHADPVNITAEEAFFLLRPEEHDFGFDMVTAVVAHEVAHQWWGKQLKSAYVAGAGLLSESLAWYSAMGVMEEKYGPEQLKTLLSFLMESYESPRSKAGVPLLQASDTYSYYRKGPLALYAMSNYIGKNKVNGALRSLLQKHRPGQTPMPTSLNLYQELQAVTPDSLQYLLTDLFKKNTFWNLKTRQATIKRTKGGTWQVTFNVQARKTVVNEMGLEKNVALTDWIEVGIFAPAKKSGETGKPLYLRKHFFNSNQKTITVTVPTKPYQAGIDPNHLLIDWDTKDNLMLIKGNDG
jgi:ABC-2 type transport system permease protein